MKKLHTFTGYIIGMLLMSVVLSGCGAKAEDYDTAPAAYYSDEADAAGTASLGTMNVMQKSANSNAYDAESTYDAVVDSGSGSLADAAAPVDESTLDTEAAAKDSSRKLIRNVNISMETTQLDELTADITKRVKELGGYVEYSWLGDNGYNNDDTRYVNYTLRIPADKLDDFLNTALIKGKITSQAENVEDITLKYSDLESKVRTLQTEQDRLLELIKSAQDVDAIIALETRLSEIRYELDSIQSSLKVYDNQVTYSTVTLYVSEVKVASAAKDATFGEKISAGFNENILKLKDNIEDAAVTLIISLPAIIVCIICAAVLLLILKLAFKAVFRILGIKLPMSLKKKAKNGEPKAGESEPKEGAHKDE